MLKRFIARVFSVPNRIEMVFMASLYAYLAGAMLYRVVTDYTEPLHTTHYGPDNLLWVYLFTRTAQMLWVLVTHKPKRTEKR